MAAVTQGLADAGWSVPAGIPVTGPAPELIVQDKRGTTFVVEVKTNEDTVHFAWLGQAAAYRTALAEQSGITPTAVVVSSGAADEMIRNLADELSVELVTVPHRDIGEAASEVVARLNSIGAAASTKREPAAQPDPTRGLSVEGEAATQHAPTRTGARDSSDPLLRYLIDQLHLNILRMPRVDLRPGQILVKQPSRVVLGTHLEALLQRAPDLPRMVRRESLPDLATLRSHRVGREVGLDVIATFLAALDAYDLTETLTGMYRYLGAHYLQFGVTDATRESLDVLELANAIASGHFASGPATITGPNRYFVIASVVHARSLTVSAEDARHHLVPIDEADLSPIAGSEVISAHKVSDGEVRYGSHVPLGIGVELYELAWDNATGTLRLGVPETPDTKVGPTIQPRPAFISANGDNALLEVAAL